VAAATDGWQASLEALTNVAKYAGPSAAEVTLRADDVHGSDSDWRSQRGGDDADRA
jgi:hypothetical protein